ncbi:hypothetical protein SETIT_8G211900v2 [Setaria italica]|uniref:Uncharacterized protein n=1 Tax=Setaria italica TaxID=4555 RepID=A0A368SA29_SETIT|nr:hypothetical protein SETIT_8G211900v2 [Setaria italica]
MPARFPTLLYNYLILFVHYLPCYFGSVMDPQQVPVV